MKTKLLAKGLELREPVIDDIDLKLTNLQKIILKNRCQDGDCEKYLMNEDYPIDKDIESLTDINTGAKLIANHIDKHNYILIVVDYDCDGINSGVMLHRCFRDIFKYNTKKFKVLVNKREFSNGFNPKLHKIIMEHNNRNKIDLIITADHGSSDDEYFKIYKQHNMDVVVTDHHKFKKYPSSADAFINTQKDDSSKVLNGLSGCAVAYMLMVKTQKYLVKNSTIKDMDYLLPYVAITTISDVMPLNNILNRKLVNLGLKELNTFKNKSFLYLKKLLDIPGSITVTDIGFAIAPLINTGNRLGVEELIFKMLIMDDKDNFMHFGTKAVSNNLTRKTRTKNIIKDLKYYIDNYEYSNSLVVVTDIDDIAINGNIASMVGGNKNVPSICFTDTGDELLKGSGRAIVDNFDLYGVLQKLNELYPGVLESFDGHKKALGCCVHRDNIDKFKKEFDILVKDELDKMDLTSNLVIDAYIPDYKLTSDLIYQLDTIGPYGEKWSPPLLVTKLMLVGMFKMGTAAKLIFNKSSNAKIEGIMFFRGNSKYTVDNIKEKLKIGERYYIVFTPVHNKYMGVINEQLNIVDIGSVND